VTAAEPTPCELAATVRAAATGDGRAQVALYAGYVAFARATARRMLAIEAWVDDVVQEAFVEAFATLPRLQHPEAFAAWLRLIVRKHADRVTRRSATRWSPYVAGTVELDPQIIVEERELADVVRDALRQARDSDRLLLGLRYYAGWTETEIAKAFATTPGTVKKRLHDARRRLRPALRTFTPEEGPSMPSFDPTPLLGRRLSPTGAALDGGSAASIPGARPTSGRQPAAAMLDTGIKVLDVFCPLMRGGTAELLGPEGCGQLVLAAELAERLAARKTVTVAAGRGSHPYGAADFAHWSGDVNRDVTVSILGEDTLDGWQQAVATAEAVSDAFLATGRDVLLVIDAKDLPAGNVDGRGLAGLSGQAAATVVFVAPDSGSEQLTEPDTRRDTSAVFSRSLVARGWYPAIHPLASRSRWLEQLRPDDRHQLVAAEAALIMDRAERTRLYLTQPFHVAVNYTGRPGAEVDLATALDDIEAILADETAATPVDQLAWRGSLTVD